jgi:hypothetical protein
MTFVRALADLFQLTVDPEGWGDSVRLSIPPAEDPANSDCRVPNVIRVDDERGVVPENYELTVGKEEERSPA